MVEKELNLSTFEQNRFEQIAAILPTGNTRRVRELAMAVRAEYVPVHDGFRDTIALTLGYLAQRYGVEVGESIGRSCVEKLMAGGDPPQYSDPDMRVRLKTIAFGWHWHATRFSLVEDDEKFTFVLHPCGSGMRLIESNYYGSGGFGPPATGSDGTPRLTRSTTANWSNFMSEDFPIYCNHCSEMGHMALKNNSGTFLVEGWTPLRSQGICLQHTFKDPAFVPDDFYHHADLPVPPRDARLSSPGRMFTRGELIEIETHPLDKLVDRAERGDLDSAYAALDECLIGWRDSIHDVYRNWMAMLWHEVLLRLDEAAFTETVRATAPDLFAHIRGAETLDWAGYWSMHLRLRKVTGKDDMTTFAVGEDSLIQPDVLPYSADWIMERLNEGLSQRGWMDIGTFAASDGLIIHRLPR